MVGYKHIHCRHLYSSIQDQCGMAMFLFFSYLKGFSSLFLLNLQDHDNFKKDRGYDLFLH